MILHVAEAGERRGRVVLQLSANQPNPVALQAALRIAQAFRSEIESLFVEDDQLVELAGFPLAREVSLSGRSTRRLSPESMARELQLVAQAAGRQIEVLARAQDVPCRHKFVRDEPVRALANACAEHGPWNVIAFADAFNPANRDVLWRIFGEVAGSTGLVLVGPGAKRSDGPIVAAVEDMMRLEPMLRSAQRLVREEGEKVTILLLADDEYKVQWMESQARLALGDTPDVNIVAASRTHGSGKVVAELLRRLGAGFVIAQFGGVLIPEDGNLGHLASGLECPMFVMR